MKCTKFFVLQVLILSSFLSLFSDNYFLTDPMLQIPTSSSVNVVWFTKSSGDANFVEYGDEFTKTATCKTTLLSRIRQDSADEHSCTFRPIYRHEAVLEGLHPGQKTPYRAVSILSEKIMKSETFFCSPTPAKGVPLKILFTSDHQGKPMVAANLQKVKEVVSDIDAVFYAGDCVDHPDKGSEWFDKNGFFACFQGRATKMLNSSVYTGGALLQSAPIFCAIGNHEVMGRWSLEKSLDAQFNDPYPRKLAEQKYSQLFPNQTDDAEREKWIKNHSFNCDSYEEIFTFPESTLPKTKYYAVSFGDIRLVVLYATRIWRKPQLGVKGKYSESPASYHHSEEWGYGDFIFEPIQKGSTQYEWLENELQSTDFQDAKYKIIMLHNPLHSMGENAIPPYTDPIQKIEKNKKGEITAIHYEYSKSEDFLIRDIEPLFTQYGVDLVLCGHTHIWNRFRSPAGINHLETSNVGNSYGGYMTIPRNLIPGVGDENYVAYGDPNGLKPILPTIAPLQDPEGNPLPFIASNIITVFSVFNTDTGLVDSYYFDTTRPDSSVIHFDRFHLGQNQPMYETVLSIKDIQECAQHSLLPDLIIFDIDNTLIESARQIALDPSINGFMRRKFPQNAEEIIRAVQAQVPWKLCEEDTRAVVKFFQEHGVKIIAVTKRSPQIRESLHAQLLDNGIDLSQSAIIAGDDILELDGGIYYKGILHAQNDKGSALKTLLQTAHWDWQNRLIYFVDDKKSHLEDYEKSFGTKIRMQAFEYAYSHSQYVDETILNLQLQDFLSGTQIQEDSSYIKLNQ